MMADQRKQKQKLRELLDSGFIVQDEYDRRISEVTEKLLACPSGHELEVLRNMDRVEVPWICDVCGFVGRLETRVGCSSCTFNLCEIGCSQFRPPSLQRGQLFRYDLPPSRLNPVEPFFGKSVFEVSIESRANILVRGKLSLDCMSQRLVMLQVDGADQATFPVLESPVRDLPFEKVLGVVEAGRHQIALELVGRDALDIFLISFLEVVEPDLSQPSQEGLAPGVLYHLPCTAKTNASGPYDCPPIDISAPYPYSFALSSGTACALKLHYSHWAENPNCAHILVIKVGLLVWTERAAWSDHELAKEVVIPLGFLSMGSYVIEFQCSWDGFSPRPPTAYFMLQDIWIIETASVSL